MAKERNNLDQFFKKRLENHTETPSKLAWERLESQLPQKSGSYKGFRWAAAASVTILLTVGYLLVREDKATIEAPLLSENKTEEITETPTPTEISTLQEIEETQPETENQQAAEELKTKPTTTTPSKVKSVDSSSTKKTQPNPQNLVAMAEVKEESKQEKPVNEVAPAIAVEIPKVTEPEFPPLALEKAVAEVKPTDTEPAYTVKIYSSGLKEEPKDKNLLAGIGKTVNEVEGLLGKVDQGFADLQDAKNSLFASITTRKSRSEE
ncbi:hypothetical protein J2X69_002450 [Algoriphagus sp. 4150]|uniref:hypothetical protein n=1 Tax=Algoriphagus sp. 4150 TaxID=2817756 RepID=UPI00285F14C7|nr:hypothetical protein [Algoriphagus sp. 4150]MDR7130103.1 hypothetical protein [Algoriphagus sp. 4150]